jgi:hypothetical protein
MQKIECSSLTINNHLNNTELKNKDFVDIPNQKTLVNHVQIATLMPVESKETFKPMTNIKDTLKAKEPSIIYKEDKQIIKQISPKSEPIINSDINEKEKLSDKNSKILTAQIGNITDNINNTSMFLTK